MAIEIVSFPIKNGGSFHSYVNVYQRVTIKPRHSVVPGTFQALVRRGFRALHPGVDLLLENPWKTYRMGPPPVKKVGL